MSGNPRASIVVIGDALLDRTWRGRAERLCPDSVGPVVDLDEEAAEAGGAALTALAANALGARTTLVTALGADAAGDLLRSRLGSVGVEVVDLGLAGATPEKIRVLVGSQVVNRLDRACATVPACGGWTSAATRAVADAAAVLLSDYGRGIVATVDRSLVAAAGDRPVVWDPHPRSAQRPSVLTLATPNLAEGRRVVGADGAADPASVAARLAERWACTVALTCATEGALVASHGSVTHVPTQPVQGDACGAGDWFAAAATDALARGADELAAVGAGCRAAARWVEHGARLLALPGVAPFHDRSVEDRPLRVVATSGCFDVLHAGHVAMLQHARSLGDRLVVLLNSDESVRALKGRDRPVNGEEDRARVLGALGCVDEVIVFGETTPCAALERLRPAVFVKGGDYRDTFLPERQVMAAWGGRIELAPLVADRSTSRVLRLAQAMAG